MDPIIALGLMTGTSMDGIDGALIMTDGQDHIHHLGGASIEYPPEFRVKLRQAANLSVQHQAYTILPELLEVEQELTIMHAELCRKLMLQHQLSAREVGVIGFSGQTLFHEPRLGISLQMGKGAMLADALGIPVINNFRQQDIVSGGQGAPLAPLYHWALGKKISPIAVVNIGGIANISLVHPEVEKVRGYDVGPGNFLLDSYIYANTQGRNTMDLDGKYSAVGVVQSRLLQQLQEYYLPFIQSMPPKSLDISQLWYPEYGSYCTYDICATLAFFTAWCIVESLVKDRIFKPTRLIAVGGGSFNPSIMKYLKEILRESTMHNTKVVSANEIGWSAKYMEAELFAFLATRSLLGMPTSYPNITGVSNPVTCGELHVA